MARSTPNPEKGLHTMTPAVPRRDREKASAPGERPVGTRARELTEEELRRAAEEWARTSGMGAHDGG